jgi:hypothetical protein
MGYETEIAVMRASDMRTEKTTISTKSIVEVDLAGASWKDPMAPQTTCF